MRFKIPSPSAQLQTDSNDPQVPPGMRDFMSSHVLNDQASSFRTFIENMRHLFNQEEEEGLVLLLSMDEQSGNLTMGIARQKRKRENSEETSCDTQLQSYLEDSQRNQDAVIREYNKRLEVAIRRKIYYHNAVEMYHAHSLAQMVSKTIMSMITPSQEVEDLEIEPKVRSLSEDTNCSVQTALQQEKLPFCMLEHD